MFIQVPAVPIPADTDIPPEKPPSSLDTAREPKHGVDEESPSCKLARTDNPLFYLCLKEASYNTGPLSRLMWEVLLYMCCSYWLMNKAALSGQM